MPTDPDLDDARNLWQSQEGEKLTIALDDVRRMAARLERRIHWRNMREYAAGVFVLAAFTVQLWRGHAWQRVPPALLIAGTIYALLELHRRGATRAHPEDSGLRASLDFHIRELERQRDALHTVWLWYLLPFVPGFVAALVLKAVESGINARLIVTNVVFVLVFSGIWMLNEWAARKLDRRIRELKEMEAGEE